MAAKKAAKKPAKKASKTAVPTRNTAPAKAQPKAGAKSKAVGSPAVRSKKGAKAQGATAVGAARAKAAELVESNASKDSASNAGIDVGDAAPSFVLQDHDGNLVSSESLRGAPYVIYFYPKDDTPGCTLEACGFRDSEARFAAKGVRILGVSPDSTKTHARFRSKYSLPFALLSDPEKTLSKAYGVWVKKQNYGREYMGILRSTFLVDRHGVVRKVWRGVRVPGHVDAVLHSAV